MTAKGFTLAFAVVIAAVFSLWTIPAADAGDRIGNAFPITTNLAADQGRPAVAYNPLEQQYLVVWHNDRPGNDDIYAQRVSSQGGLLPGWFAVSAGPGADRRYPDVVHNSARNEYLVVWEHEVPTGFSVRGQRIAADGQLIGGEIQFCSSDLSLANRFQPAVAYAAHEDVYLVVWERSVQGAVANDVQGQAVSSAGTPVPICHLYGEGTFSASHERPALAYNRSRNEYLIVWQRMSGDYDIYGRRAQGDGTPMGAAPSVITAQVGDDTNPAVGAIPTVPNEGRYLVVFESPNYSPPVQNIYAVRLLGDLTQEGSILWLSQQQTHNVSPAVAGQEAAVATWWL